MRKISLPLLCGVLLLSLGVPCLAQGQATPPSYTPADARTLDQQLARFPRKATASVLCTNENVAELKALLLKASALSWQRSRDPEAGGKRSQLEALLKEHELTPAQAHKLADAVVVYRQARGGGSARRKSTAEKVDEAGATVAQELATTAAVVALDFMKGFVKGVGQ